MKMGIFAVSRRPKPAPPVLSPEAEFWAWFAANEAMLWEIDADAEAVLEALALRMCRVDIALAFDFGPVRDGRREFVVTAAGQSSAFPAVLRLTSAAPPLERWTVTAFRPRREFRGEVMRVRGRTLRLDDVRFTAEPVGGRLKVKLLIPGYRRTLFGDYELVGRFLVDLAVGEFDAETRLAGVAVGPSQPDVESRPLADLPALVDSLTGE
jgi:hypothetical protein